MANVLWKDRKRPFLGLPLSFTKYTITEEKLIINTGFFRINEEEIRLYRILDASMNQSLLDRMFRVGNVAVESSDRSSGNITIRLVKDPRKVKDLISNIVEEERSKKRVSVREFMTDEDGLEGDMDI